LFVFKLGKDCLSNISIQLLAIIIRLIKSVFGLNRTA
jgi:hypothetical protein